MLATSAAARLLARRTFTPAVMGVRGMASLEAYDEFGKNLFTGKVADEYLKKHGASGAILKDPSWVKTHADVVANAVFDW
jgi:glutamine synthetase